MKRASRCRKGCWPWNAPPARARSKFCLIFHVRTQAIARHDPPWRGRGVLIGHQDLPDLQRTMRRSKRAMSQLWRRTCACIILAGRPGVLCPGTDRPGRPGGKPAALALWHLRNLSCPGAGSLALRRNRAATGLLAEHEQRCSSSSHQPCSRATHDCSDRYSDADALSPLR